MAKRKNIKAIIGYLILAIPLLLGSSESARASIRILDEYQCTDLIAGGTIIAGTVCSEVSGENLLVTYSIPTQKRFSSSIGCKSLVYICNRYPS